MNIEFKGIVAQFITSMGVASLVAIVGIMIGVIINLVIHIHHKMLNQKGEGFIKIKEDANEIHH
jgi:uncharacterized membrane protein YciS (DUF1049 family)